jgi:hypothetical protein
MVQTVQTLPYDGGEWVARAKEPAPHDADPGQLHAAQWLERPLSRPRLQDPSLPLAYRPERAALSCG